VLRRKGYGGREIVLKIQTYIIFQSFQSLLSARCGTNGRNPEDGKDFKILATAQQVLKVALLFPVLGRKILFSSRKGAWDRVRKGLVPLEAGGTVPIRDF
jgi:hypothetical protein